MVYSKQKSEKYTLPSLRLVLTTSDFPAERPVYIVNDLMDVHEIFYLFDFKKLNHKNFMYYSTFKSIKLAFTYFGTRLNLKLRLFSPQDDLDTLSMS